MSKLSYQKRQELPKSSFVFKKGGPGKTGKYPIDTINRGRNALARVSQFGTPAEKASVRRRVFAKYPQIDKKKK